MLCGESAPVFEFGRCHLFAELMLAYEALVGLNHCPPVVKLPPQQAPHLGRGFVEVVFQPSVEIQKEGGVHSIALGGLSLAHLH